MPREDLAAVHAERRRVEGPIVADLRAAGLDVDSLGELVNTNLDYRAQLPVLLDWLPRCPEYVVRGMIARALTIPAARRTEAPDLLLREFRDAPTETYRWVVGNALSVVARPRDAGEVVGLFTDPRSGIGRQELARAVARLRPPGALEALVAALDDDDVEAHAVEALGALRDPRAIPHLEGRTFERAWVARAARSAIRRIERSAATPPAPPPPAT